MEKIHETSEENLKQISTRLCKQQYALPWGFTNCGLSIYSLKKWDFLESIMMAHYTDKTTSAQLYEFELESTLRFRKDTCTPDVDS